MQYPVKIDIKLSNKNVYQYLQRRITLSILTPVTHHFETLAVPPDGPPGHLLVVDLGHGLHGNHSLYTASVSALNLHLHLMHLQL